MRRMANPTEREDAMRTVGKDALTQPSDVKKWMAERKRVKTRAALMPDTRPRCEHHVVYPLANCAPCLRAALESAHHCARCGATDRMLVCGPCARAEAGVLTREEREAVERVLRLIATGEAGAYATTGMMRDLLAIIDRLAPQESDDAP